jgi:hypothetical protein
MIAMRNYLSASLFSSLFLFRSFSEENTPSQKLYNPDHLNMKRGRLDQVSVLEGGASATKRKSVLTTNYLTKILSLTPRSNIPYRAHF